MGMERLRKREGTSGNPYDALRQMDWTFAQAPTRGATHGIHPYPAKFIPQIPRGLIEILHPGDDTAILDPFCGSGTTLVEAALAGYMAVGIDVNPLSCLISKVKVTPLVRSLAKAAQRVVQHARRHPASPPDIPALDHWFEAEVQIALASLVRAIDRETDGDVRDALRVALSSIIVRVSNQESDTRYAAINKNVDPRSVATQFLTAATGLEGKLTSTWGGLLEPSRVEVLNRDVLAVQSTEIHFPVSLVVTSPPYPNAYEYWLYHKYRMYWLGMDPLPVKEREIGARPHFFKKNPHTAADFLSQMTTVFALLADVVVKGGHVCFQVGDSVISGVLVDNSAIVRESASSAGFAETAVLSREIPSTRKAFNPKHGRIKRENILVFPNESVR